MRDYAFGVGRRAVAVDVAVVDIDLPHYRSGSRCRRQHIRTGISSVQFSVVNFLRLHRPDLRKVN